MQPKKIAKLFLPFENLGIVSAIASLSASSIIVVNADKPVPVQKASTTIHTNSLPPMLIMFLNVPAYEAIGIALASDVLASAVSAYEYGKKKNIDIKTD